MALIGSSVPTLVDVAKRLDPDGKIAELAELLRSHRSRHGKVKFDKESKRINVVATAAPANN